MRQTTFKASAISGILDFANHRQTAEGPFVSSFLFVSL